MAALNFGESVLTTVIRTGRVRCPVACLQQTIKENQFPQI
jgi:hypothetical protein